MATSDGRTGPDADAVNTFGFVTERVAVEVPTVDDADELYHLVGGEHREEVCATLAWDGPDDRSDIEWWVDQCRTATFTEWGFHWVMRDRSGLLTGTPGRPLGAIGTRPTGVPGRADVGYWLGRPYWSQGIVTEALTALVDLGRTELDYAKLEATVFAHNGAGRRLVDKVGFEAEGLVRRGHRKGGRWVDCALYGLLL